jgi:branched-chain amino acid transport system substrate-binding protein
MNKQSWIFIGLLIAALIVIGIFVERPTKNTEGGGPIKIGFVTPLTGDSAAYGTFAKNSASIAVDEINAAGGIDGRPIEMIYRDSKCKGKDALSAVQSLITIDNVKILNGFLCGEDVMAAAPVIEQNKIIALAPVASSPEVTKAGDYIFQNNPPSQASADKLVEVMIKKYKNVAVISENSGFAKDLNDYFAKRFAEGGGTVVIDELYQSDVRDFRSSILKIKEKNPEAIFVNPQAEVSGGAIIKQLRELGVTAPLYGTDPLGGSQTIEIAGKSAEGLTIISAPGLDSGNPDSKAFLAKYKEKFGEPTFELYMGTSYDSVYLIKEAIEAVGENPTKMRDYFYNIKNHKSIVGTYHFDKNGDMVGIEFVEKQIKDGELEIVK